MTAPDLAAFLLARITEDESIAHRASEYPGSYRGHPAGTAPLWTTSAASAYGREVGPRGSVEATPGRILAECAAKRGIVEMHRHDHACPDSSGMDDYTWVTAPRNANCATMLALAQPYADHPDFNPAWQV